MHRATTPLPIWRMPLSSPFAPQEDVQRPDHAPGHRLSTVTNRWAPPRGWDPSPGPPRTPERPVARIIRMYFADLAPGAQGGDDGA